MPKVKPLTSEQKAKSRWQEADDNFRMQIRALLIKSGMTKGELGMELGMSRPTLLMRIKHPSTLEKKEERMLAMLFERYGMHYDMTMGEGGAQHAAVVC